VLLVNVRDLFGSRFLLIVACYFAGVNFGGKNEPNGAVVILGKFGAHFENFLVVHLLDVVAHLVALLHTVGLIVARGDHIDLLA
jgi:hypothetical protein